MPAGAAARAGGQGELRVYDKTSTASLRLARWAAGLTAGEVPPDVRRAASNCIQDTLGVALAGSLLPAAGAARALCPAPTDGPCAVLGLGAGHAPAPAAFVNATAAHALDFDDNCYAGFVHGSAVIVPALLACAQAIGAAGAQAITALVAGAECEYAVGRATRGILYGQGWWTTGVLGPIGAAVAVARLLGLDAVRTHHALALAAGMASGTKSCFGSDAKPLMAGKAAEAGVQAALLAQAGATAAADPFGHPHGFAARYNQGIFDADALDRLGSAWYLRDPGVDVKRIPVCLSSHAAVDALRDLMARHALAADEVDQVICDVPPVVVANLCYGVPDSVAQARFSMPFAIAMTLLDPDWGLPALTPGQLARADLRALMQRVRMETGAAWDDAALRQAAPEGARVRVVLRDGRVLRAGRDKAAGSPADPLSPAQQARKFLDCSVPAVGRVRGARLLRQLQALDGPAPVQALFDTLAAPPPAGGGQPEERFPDA